MINKASPSFWSSLPGILTGVAAIITAATGLYLAIHTRPSGDQASKEVQAGEHEDTVAAAPAKSLASTSTASVATTDSVRSEYLNQSSTLCKRGAKGYYLFAEGVSLNEKDSVDSLKIGNDHLVFDQDSGKSYLCKGYYNQPKQDDNPYLATLVVDKTDALCRRGSDGYYLYFGGEALHYKDSVTSSKLGNDHLVYDQDNDVSYLCKDYYKQEKKADNDFLKVEIRAPG